MHSRFYSGRSKVCLMSVILLLSACNGQSSESNHRPEAASQLGTTTAPKSESESSRSKIAFVYAGKAADSMAYQFPVPANASVEAAENVSPVEADASLRRLAKAGAQVVFVTHPRFSEATLKVAPDFPKTIFAQAGGVRGANNVSTFDARIYEAAYLAGIVAAGTSKNYRIGVLASTPTVQTIRNINAYTLGAQTIFPQMHVRVAWAQSPSKVSRAMQTLIDEEVDVILPLDEVVAASEYAARHRIAIFNWLNTESLNANVIPLAQIQLAWQPYMNAVWRDVSEQRWEAHQAWWGMYEGVLSFDKMSLQVPPKIAQQVTEKIAAIKDGKLHPFSGPLADKGGQVLAPKGAVVSDALLKSMATYVPGVRGHPPKTLP